ncbi:CBS domain-containing protein [[Eubacterium] cellulosolvens]
MKVSDLTLHDEYKLIDAEKTVEDAAKEMMDKSILALIIQEGNKPVGIISRYDFVEIIAGGKDWKDIKAKDIMSSPLITVSPETDVKEAAKIMIEKVINVLPVIDKKGDLQGVVTYFDVMELPKMEEFQK